MLHLLPMIILDLPRYHGTSHFFFFEVSAQTFSGGYRLSALMRCGLDRFRCGAVHMLNGL